MAVENDPNKHQITFFWQEKSAKQLSYLARGHLFFLSLEIMISFSLFFSRGKEIEEKETVL